MNPADLAPIQRQPFALACGVATVAGIAIALALASRGGGEGLTLAAVAACIAAFGALCLVPLMGPPLVTSDRFGMVVFGVSGVRTMLVLGAMIGLTEGAGLPKTPVVHALLGGVLPIMVGEALAAAWVIHRRDLSARPSTVQRSA